MVRQLMTFTGQREPLDRRLHDVGSLIEQVVAMCRNTFDRHIGLSCAIATGLPPIRCTSNELEQVVMNVLVNARDAVADSGRPTQIISITVDAIPDPLGSEIDWVRVTITDDGIGMTEDVALRAFDPFFSTKAVGRGTGLGLTTSYAIVRELQGTMTCTSAPGAGTTLVVCLPGTAGVPVEGTPAVRPTHARRRVLLIDDDASVRNAVSAMLASEGFDIDAVATGDAGLAHLVTRAPLDLILLDRSMPGAPGETYVPGIRVLAPNIPIVMFTGQAVGPTIAALVDRVILKPITGSALIEAIEAVVRKRATAGAA
jgi:CheY-like chemotaxis protein